MKKIHFLLTIVLLLIVSCTTKDSSSMSGQSSSEVNISGMPVDTVVQLLGDMHYAHVAAQVNRQVNSDSLKIVYEDQVLQIHSLSRERYIEIKKSLENDMDLYYVVEQKVHEYLKSLREDDKD